MAETLHPSPSAKRLFIATGAFTIKGKGTVLTGTVFPGTKVKPGDVIEVRSQGKVMARMPAVGVDYPAGLVDGMEKISVLINPSVAMHSRDGLEVWLVAGASAAQLS
jgi:hypothetical protein